MCSEREGNKCRSKLQKENLEISAELKSKVTVIDERSNKTVYILKVYLKNIEKELIIIYTKLEL